VKDHGYVYVLMNPSMDNLVKIGKTERSPKERAKELSSTTGVPTPFVVVYESYFKSCTKAEKFVHTHLESRGFRVSVNREFFEIPIKEAIDAVIMANTHFGDFKSEDSSSPHLDEEGVFTEDTNDDFLSDMELKDTSQHVEPWEEMFKIAETFYHGHGDEIQDYKEALEYYLKSIKLGSLNAYTKIGTMYAEGEGVKVNNNTAFKYFKEGAKKGEISCYSRMAKLFNEQGNIENAKKCWKRYFEQSEKIEPFESFYYMINFIKHNDLALEHIEKLESVKIGIIDRALLFLECVDEMLELAESDRLMLTSMYQENLEYIQLHFK